MRFLKIIIIAVFIFSLVPLESFCHNHEEDAQHNHCVVVCHQCHSNVVVADQLMPIPPQKSSKLILSIDFTYKNPTRPAFLRPPVVLS